MKRFTPIYVVALVLLTVAVDVVLYALGGGEATISTFVLERCHRYPVIAFGMGFVCGHLVWPNHVERDDRCKCRPS